MFSHAFEIFIPCLTTLFHEVTTRISLALMVLLQVEKCQKQAF